MTVIGLGGKLRAGKDAVADHLVEKHGYVKIGMSDPLRERLRILNPWIKVRLGEALRLRIRPGFHRAADLLDRLGYVEAKTIRDLREFMQRDGSDGGREMFGEDVWTNIVRRRIDELEAKGIPVVLTGLRFPNELPVVDDRFKGITIWVERPGIEVPSTGTAAHSSENSVTVGDFDFALDNDGTLEQLYAKVDVIAAEMSTL